MTLGSTPSLTEINTELGTTGQKLSTCIANAGETGMWDRQSDFAGYSHTYVETDPSTIVALGNDTSTVTNITSSSNWEHYGTPPSWVTSVTSSGSSGQNANVVIETNPGGQRIATLTFRLISDNSVTNTFEITQQPV